jgi:heme-degrading monooxygenase HmoA
MSTPSGPDGTDPSESTDDRPPDVPPPFSEGQVVTVFRSQRRADTDDEYGELAEAMLAAARVQPGFVDFARFESPEGERVSLVTFSSAESQAAWRDDLAHRAAQARGRAVLYDWYSVQVSRCTSTSQWWRPGR